MAKMEGELKSAESQESEKTWSAQSISEAKKEPDLKDTQVVDDWGQPDKQTEAVKSTKGSISYLVLNALMFCGLITSPDILWTFPRHVIESGGVFFILLYGFMLCVIAFPLLHMELFVGQRSQSGIIRTMRIYGYGFECIGVGIFCLTLLRSLAGIQHSYILVRHLINLLFDGEGIMSCDYSVNRGGRHSAQCVSYVDDLKCTSGSLYYGGKCVNYQNVGNMTTVSDVYSDALIKPQIQDFDFERMLYNTIIYGIVGIIGFFGYQVIRNFLISIFCCFVVTFFTMAYPFLSMGADFGNMIHVFSLFTTLESLFNLDTYVKALNLSLATTGIGLSGVLCASSFRSKRGNAFMLTYAIVINVAVLSFVSLIYAFCMLNVTNYDPSSKKSQQRLHFILGILTDLFLSRRRSIFWPASYTISVILLNIKSFFAPLIMVYAFVRDHAHSHRLVWNAIAVASFSVVCFLLSIFRCLPGMNEKYHLYNNDLYYTTIFLVLAALVIIFVHLYGKREYLIDLCDVYTLKEKANPLTSPTHSWQFNIFYFVPFAFLVFQLYSVTDANHPLRLNDFWSLLFQHVLIMLLTIVVACFIVRVSYVFTQQSNWFVLFSITPEHPSYKRISSGWKSGTMKHDKDSATSITPIS